MVSDRPRALRGKSKPTPGAQQSLGRLDNSRKSILRMLLASLRSALENNADPENIFDAVVRVTDLLRTVAPDFVAQEHDDIEHLPTSFSLIALIAGLRQERTVDSTGLSLIGWDLGIGDDWFRNPITGSLDLERGLLSFLTGMDAIERERLIAAQSASRTSLRVLDIDLQSGHASIGRLRLREHREVVQEELRCVVLIKPEHEEEFHAKTVEANFPPGSLIPHAMLVGGALRSEINAYWTKVRRAVLRHNILRFKANPRASILQIEKIDVSGRTNYNVTYPHPLLKQLFNLDIIARSPTDEKQPAPNVPDWLLQVDAYAKANPGQPVSTFALSVMPATVAAVEQPANDTAIALPEKAPIYWRNRKHGESAVEFAVRAYGKPWMEARVITLPDIRRLDPELHSSINSWLKYNSKKAGPEPLPEGFYLPTLKELNEAWIERVRSGEQSGFSDLKEAQRFERMARRRRMAVKGGKE